MSTTPTDDLDLLWSHISTQAGANLEMSEAHDRLRAVLESRAALLEACKQAERYIGLIDKHPAKADEIEWGALYELLHEAVEATEGSASDCS